MTNAINSLIKAEVANGRSTIIYEILGKFGDKLPKDVQEALYEKAEMEKKVSDDHKKKAKIS